MNPELNTLVLVGIPTTIGMSSYFITQKLLAIHGRQLVVENRYDELITQGFIERTIAPASIWLVSMLAASVIGKEAPLNIESFTHIVGALSVLTSITGSTLGCIVDGSLKIDLGRQFKILNPNAKPRTVIDEVAYDVVQPSLPEQIEVDLRE